MERNIMQKITLLFLILIIFISCYNSSFTSPNTKGDKVQKSVNRGLIDTTETDTTTWRTEYEKYYKKLDLTLRSREKIDSIITHNEHYILNILNKYDIKECDTIIFSISSKGLFEIPEQKKIKNTDTSTVKARNNAILEISLDSISSEKYCTRGDILYTSKKLTLLDTITYGEGRSRALIMRSVMQYLKHMRTAYNRRLRVKYGIKGRITVKWAIDKYGIVIFTKILSSTVDDEKLEQAIVEQIKHWKFCFVLNEKDVTEVVYPFVFSQ